MPGHLSDIDNKEFIRLQIMVSYENQAYTNGFRCIAGIDEAGRGPLAGPVVACACILPQGLLIAKVDDSKKLTSQTRAKLYERLVNDPTIMYGIGIIDSQKIDRTNIYQATIQAMHQAIAALKISPDYLLVDGMPLANQPIPYLKINKGDQLSLSIAAASIIAKHTRDTIMLSYDKQWPEYGFASHKGYGTPQHLETLNTHGPCPIHRFSFDPLKTKYLIGTES